MTKKNKGADKLAKTNKSARALLKDTRGANLVEYIILVGVVALIALAGYKIFGTSVTTKIGEQASGVDSINGAAH
jgi:pilus assembly protein Flp/PilA